MRERGVLQIYTPQQALSVHLVGHMIVVVVVLVSVTQSYRAEKPCRVSSFFFLGFVMNEVHLVYSASK